MLRQVFFEWGDKEATAGCQFLGENETSAPDLNLLLRVVISAKTGRILS